MGSFLLAWPIELALVVFTAACTICFVFLFSLSHYFAGTRWQIQVPGHRTDRPRRRTAGSQLSQRP
jgi:hypothetical protein